MMNKNLGAIAFATITVVAGPVYADLAASLPFDDFSSLGAHGFDYIQGSYGLGYLFQPTKNVFVTSLGFYDDNKDGFRRRVKIT